MVKGGLRHYLRHVKDGYTGTLSYAIVVRNLRMEFSQISDLNAAVPDISLTAGMQIRTPGINAVFLDAGKTDLIKELLDHSLHGKEIIF